MKKQMNKALQWEGGDVLFVSQWRHFHMMDWKGLATLHVVEQHEVKINFEKGEPKIWTNTEIRSMERLVTTIDMEDS